MTRPSPSSPRTDPLVPSPTLFRSRRRNLPMAQGRIDRAGRKRSAAFLFDSEDLLALDLAVAQTAAGLDRNIGYRPPVQLAEGGESVRLHPHPPVDPGIGHQRAGTRQIGRAHV